MQLPNKLYSYNNSTLSLIPLVLDEIKNGPVEVKVLYERIKPSLKDSTDFISVMDCLYALRAADLNDEGGVFISRIQNTSKRRAESDVHSPDLL